MVAQTIFIRRAAIRFWLPALGSLVGLALVFGWWTTAARVARAADPAAPYLEMPVDPPSLRGWNKASNASQNKDPRAMLRGDLDWNVVVFDAYFNNILFPQFTLYKEPGANVLTMTEDPKNKAVKWRHSMLPTCRDEFTKFFILQAGKNSNQEPFNHLTQITIQAMRTIALGNYHPLARYNAALLIASLQESGSEKPLRTTIPALLACLDSIDVVRVAALDGLLKHAEAGTEGAARPQFIAAMLKIVNEKTPPKGRTADGHDWIRRRAIDVLAALGDAGPNLTVVAALDGILKDSQSSPELSCSAAKALGSISFHAPESMNASATAASIGQVAVDAYKAELARADERRDAAGVPAPTNAASATAGGLLGAAAQPGAAGAGLAGATNRELFVSIPLLRSQLYALDRGLKGLSTATAGTKHQQFVESVEKNLALLMAACDPKAADYDVLKTGISKAGAGLEAALAGGAAGAQGRAPAPEKATGASKEDSFDAEPEKPAAAPAATAPRAGK
ncbi:MAG TPA: hypothetical protein VHX65_08545 [Pirellulales bacterium]|jgi:hypothetical protein|nr:hypothetical protein [Pirellulales bacterium]